MSEVSVVLSVPAASHRVRTPVNVAIEVRNVSARPLWMAGVVDGSEQGVRFPHYLPRVSRSGEVVAHPPRPEDPLVSPLHLTDFLYLQPGEAFDPTGRERGGAFLPIATFSTFRPAEAGRYTFQLTLSTEGEAPEQWLGRFGQEASRAAVMERVALVPRLTVQSNALAVDIG